MSLEQLLCLPEDHDRRVRIELVEGLAPVEQHRRASLEGTEVIAPERVHHRKECGRQLAQLAEQRAPVRQAREQALETLPSAPVGDRQGTHERSAFGVDAFGEEGPMSSLITRELQREAPRVQPVRAREGPAGTQHRLQVARVQKWRSRTQTTCARQRQQRPHRPARLLDVTPKDFGQRQRCLGRRQSASQDPRLGRRIRALVVPRLVGEEGS